MNSILHYRISSLITLNYSASFFRYIRNPSKRVSAIKTLKEFKVKHMNDDEEYNSSFDFIEMSRRIKENDLDIEKSFEKEEDFDSIVNERRKLNHMQMSEMESKKVPTKKKLIGRKYFKSGKETNLLTHAAKEQIRYLHRLNPLDWTPEALSKSFPISVDGVKKLLKSYFTLKDPVKIKAHDEDVRRKWQSLMSGKPADDVYFHTQCLWNEGKILKENYNGNPNLPCNSDFTAQNTITIAKKKSSGEFSAIIKNYVEYKNRTQSENKNNSELIVSSKTDDNKSKGSEYDLNVSNVIQNSKIFKEEGDMVIKKNYSMSETDLPFSQFKENMKHNTQLKSKHTNASNQYPQWIEKDTKEKDFRNTPSSYDANEFVSKISKYNKENIEIKRDRNKSGDSLYLYNENMGYQFPVGKTVKGKISLPGSAKKKKSLYKVKQCVYDEDGEFLYKLPG